MQVTHDKEGHPFAELFSQRKEEKVDGMEKRMEERLTTLKKEGHTLAGRETGSSEAELLSRLGSSKYQPHQGQQEKERRIRQQAKLKAKYLEYT